MYMQGKKIIICGGSIAGCVSAILLSRLGVQIKILERSGGQIKSGSGITLPESIVDECITHDLLDPNIPRLKIKNRCFIRKDKKHQDLKFWDQSVSVQALNWVDVYKNLRKRINPEDFLSKTEITSIEENKDGCLVKTLSGYEQQADFIIAADGVDSVIRSSIKPDVSPEYAGYVAWRGIIDDRSIIEKNNFNTNVSYYV